MDRDKKNRTERNKRDQKKNIELRRGMMQENKTTVIANESTRRIQCSAQRNPRKLLSKNSQVDQAGIYRIWVKNNISCENNDVINILNPCLLFRITFVSFSILSVYRVEKSAKELERKTRGSPFRCTLRKYSNLNGPLRALFSRRRRHCAMVRRTGFYGLMF